MSDQEATDQAVPDRATDEAAMTSSNHRHYHMRPGDLVTLVLGGAVYIGVLVAVFLV